MINSFPRASQAAARRAENSSPSNPVVESLNRTMPPEAINIGPRERRKRRLLGIVSLTVGVAAAFLLVIYGAPRLSRLVIFFPIWMAGLGLMQARERICISLAARGVCNLDTGEEEIGDESLTEALRVKARSINRRALITAAAATLVALAFP
ncbi:MAG: hypothetical protein WCD76_18070 [Pyrinomonadaceae bacterium]